jgi:hypothetical protein
MIFFFQQGRLGNQLFQFAYLRQSFPTKFIICFGCEELKKFVSKDKKIFFSPMTRPGSFFWKICKLIILILSKIRLIKFIKEKNANKLAVINKNRNFFVEGFFQYGSFGDANSSKIIFNSIKKNLNSLDVVNPKNSCFIHVRRTDYLIWPFSCNPAVLKDKYYMQSVYFMIKKFKIKTFYVVSDDIKYCKILFKYIPNIKFVSKNVTDDLLLMGSIKFGILSASSLSWWGSYLSHMKFKTGFYLAPKYWAGHRQKKWYPKFIKTKFHQYVNDYN